MTTIKIPEGWYEITGQPTRRPGDQFVWALPNCFSSEWQDIYGKESEQEYGCRYIRRMDCNQLQAEQARLDPKYRPDYQNPVMGKETAKDGVLAAAEEIFSRCNVGKEQLIEILRRHCVTKPDWDELMEGPFARAVIERKLATEKARADNLQAELQDADRALAISEDCQRKLADERDSLRAELGEAERKLRAINNMLTGL